MHQTKKPQKPEFQRKSSAMGLGGVWNGCDSTAFRSLWAAAASALGFEELGFTATAVDYATSLAALRWTARADQEACPVAVAVGKLAHSLVTFRRDWHGDMGKVKARPIHMLQIPLKHELQLILQAELILPQSQTALQWHLLLYYGLAQLSSLLCPESSEVVLDYKLYCQQRPWTLGCTNTLPSCNDTAQWRKSPTDLLHCAAERETSRVLRCLGLGMPANPERLLDLVVPLQISWWHAVAALLKDRHTVHRGASVAGGVGGLRVSAPCREAIASEYLAVALCPHGPIAPKHGHIARSEVLENRLEAVAFAATAQELVGCGVQIEIHLVKRLHFWVLASALLVVNSVPRGRPVTTCASAAPWKPCTSRRSFLVPLPQDMPRSPPCTR